MHLCAFTSMPFGARSGEMKTRQNVKEDQPNPQSTSFHCEDWKIGFVFFGFWKRFLISLSSRGIFSFFFAVCVFLWFYKWHFLLLLDTNPHFVIFRKLGEIGRCCLWKLVEHEIERNLNNKNIMRDPFSWLKTSFKNFVAHFLVCCLLRFLFNCKTMQYAIANE